MSQANQRITLESAYVLHQRPYQDSSLLLDVFSASHGRVGLIARGVRKKKGRWQSALQPFVPVLISWSGRGELGTVIDVEMESVAWPLKGQVLLSSFYINELLTRLLHRHDPHPGLFDYYHTALENLSTLSADVDHRQSLQRQLRLFEKQLLHETGYDLILTHEVTAGEMIEPEQLYRYMPGQGPVRLAEGENPSIGLVMKGASLLSFEQEQLDDVESLRDAKRLTRAVLDQYLGSRPLHSRKLLMDLQRTAEAAVQAQLLS